MTMAKLAVLVGRPWDRRERDGKWWEAVTVRIWDPVTLHVIVMKAGKPGFGLTCTSPLPTVRSSSSYVFVIQAATGL